MQPSFTPTVQLQALTVVTLAKMCLQNEEMAKKVVPAFGRLLDTTSDAALKNNIMYALSDMCVRYASLVDPLLPQMTACLRDPGKEQFVYNISAVCLHFSIICLHFSIGGPENNIDNTNSFIARRLFENDGRIFLPNITNYV